MKFKKMMLIGILLVILTMGAASADDNATSDTLTDEGDIGVPLEEVNSDDITDLEVDEENSNLDEANVGSDVLKDDPVQTKQDLNVSLSDSYYIVGTAPTLYIYSNNGSAYSSPINISVDGNLYKQNAYFSEYGVISLNLGSSYLTKGIHSLVLTSSGNDKFNPLNATLNYEAVECLAYMNDIDLTDYDDRDGDYYYSAYLPFDASGTLTFYIDNKEISKTSIKYNPNLDVESRQRRVSFKVPRLEAGTHEAKITYSGDDKYSSQVKNRTITVYYKIYSVAGLNESGNWELYGNSSLYFRFPKDVAELPIVLIDGEKHDSKLSGNMLQVNVSDVGIGQHYINVTYPGDGRYESSSIGGYFYIRPGIASNDWQFVEYYYLRLPKNATGNLTMRISDEFISHESDGVLIANVPLVDGYASVSVKDIPLGNYYVRADYTGDDYDVYYISGQLTIKPKVTYPEKMTYGEKKFLYINSSSVNNGTIRLVSTYDNGLGQVSQVYAEAQLVNGCAKIPLDKLMAYKFKLYYGNSSAHLGEYAISITPIWSISGKNVNSYYGDDLTYKVKVLNETGQPYIGCNVVFEFKGVTYSVVTDKNGVAALKLSKIVKINNLMPGKYKITVRCCNDPISCKNTITVTKVLALKAVKVKKSAKKLVLTATLKKGKKAIKGKYVTFKFNGKTYKAKTNKKGVAKYTIKKAVLNKLKVGKTVKYQATYLKDTVKKSVKVKK